MKIKYQIWKTNYPSKLLTSQIARSIPKSLESWNHGRREEEVLASAHPHLSLLLPREMLGEKGLLEKGGLRSGDVRARSPFQSTGRRGTRTWHTSVIAMQKAWLISRELNLPSLTAASTKEIVDEFDPGGIPWLSWTRRSLNFKKGGEIFRWKIGRRVDRCIWFYFLRRKICEGEFQGEWVEIFPFENEKYRGVFFLSLPSNSRYLFYYISVKVLLFSYFLMRNTVILYSVYE